MARGMNQFRRGAENDVWISILVANRSATPVAECNGSCVVAGGGDGTGLNGLWDGIPLGGLGCWRTSGNAHAFRYRLEATSPG
jgi:hypothetical protein